MNNNSEEYFSVGGQCIRNVDGDGFTPGDWGPSAGNSNSNSGKKQCKVTMVWADWCGFSKKAKPEWDKLVSNWNNKEIDGCLVTFEDAEEKVSPDIVKKFKTTGFPTYYCEMDGKVEEFNSIKEPDMLDKVKASIAKMKGGKEGFNVGGQEQPKANARPAPKPAPNKPAPKPAPNKPAPKPAPKPNAKPNAKPSNYTQDYNSVRSTVEGEILFSSCDDSEYGPIRLDSVDRNLAGVGNAQQNVLGFGDCTELEFAPVKFSTGGPQIPSMNSLMPSLAQLKAPPIDGVQGIHRPAAFNSPPNGNRPNGNGGNGGNSANAGGKKAQVTMVRADWCGFCKKAKPEWEKLKSEIHNKVVNGYHIVLRDLEQKKDESEIKEKYPDVNGFPTYVVEKTDSSGKMVKSGTFNSIEKNDMHEKIKQNLQ
jgi:thiol-disulfide isomerase/thioredoxin